MSLKSFGKEVINAYSQGKPVLRAYSNGKLAYRQQQEIIYSAKVKTQGAYIDIDDYLCSFRTVVKFKLLIPSNIVVANDYRTIIGRSKDDGEFFWFAKTRDNNDGFAYYVKDRYQPYLVYPTKAFDRQVNVEMSCNNLIIDDVVFTGNPSDYVAPVNGIQIFATKRWSYPESIMDNCGITIGSNIEIYDRQDDGSLVLKRNLYFLPQGDTQHSAIPAPVGGACWCRVTNRYYNVLQNNGVGELEFEPISVNKNPRTEYSCESLTADMFETSLTVPTDSTVKFVTSFKTLEGYTTLLRLNDSSTIDIGVNLYVENGATVKLQHNGATYEAPYAFAIDTDYTFAITPTSLKINGVDVLTYPVRTYPVDTLTWYCNLTNVLKSSILVYNTSPIAELIPVPQGDVQYSDVPAPVGGALWGRVTNKYYAKQGTGALKFTTLHIV